MTIPAGTPKTAPLVTPTTFPVRRVTRIDWHVPPGPSGLAGWRVTMGGVQVIPANPGAWIVRDGQAGAHELAGLPTSGAWDVTGYNTGAFPHTLYVTFTAEIITAAPAAAAPAPLGLLQPGLDAPPAHQTYPRQG